ncbi:MAG TPA: hypothetical protein VJ967_07225 [Clostridia bacterium]|nr:hypothetical protein [Clostridia bacterium]
MKRRVILLTLLIFILIAGFTYAEQSNYYVKSVPIDKVYMHSLGYRIVYQKSNLNFGVFYVPEQWFDMPENREQDPKAELIMARNEAYPYFSIFWEAGEFSHIRLYLNKNLNHLSYGNLETPENFDNQFDIETLSIEF